MALSRLTQLLKNSPVAAPALPAGLRLYVIGDVHGRLDLLDRLSAHIDADAAGAAGDVLTIFLGDYIDRGKDSAGVIERLSGGDFPTPICALRGNHEEILLRFLEDESLLESWRKYGGLETLHSYGVDVGEAMRGRGYDAARASLLARLPEAHLHFLQKTRLWAAHGDYFFAHAGIRPERPLSAQTADDLLWIRDEFLRFPGKLEKIVVHGHTPVEAPDIQANRINIDTGAYLSSVLTALVLEGADRRFIQARAS